MSDFVSFARAHGLRLDHAVADGKWRRVPTEDKPRKRNGAYVLDERGGAVKNWACMDGFAYWRPDDPSDFVPIDRELLRKRAAAARKEEAEKRAMAAQEAARIVKAAQLLTPRPATLARGWKPAQEAVLAHPYLVRKGLPEAAGLVHEGFLIVPMRVDGEHHQELVNVQRIAEDGQKRFLPGGRAKGAFYRIGPARAREVWLAEGFATGLSLDKALKALYRNAAVIVCFSAGELHHASATHVMADNDQSGVGQRAAEATGLPWVMPPEVGMDCNDLMVKDGLRAVVELLRTVRARA